jgi:hypothetical protein
MSVQNVDLTKETHPLIDGEIPQDKYNLVYLTFLMMGAGFLFPWYEVIFLKNGKNMEICAIDFATTFQNNL